MVELTPIFQRGLGLIPSTLGSIPSIGSSPDSYRDALGFNAIYYFFIFKGGLTIPEREAFPNKEFLKRASCGEFFSIKGGR